MPVRSDDSLAVLGLGLAVFGRGARLAVFFIMSFLRRVDVTALGRETGGGGYGVQ